MTELLPNLVPPTVLLLLWALAHAGGGDTRTSRSFSRGFLFALVVTSVAALPPVLLSASNGFRGLGMMWMVTLLLAMFGVAGGAIAFAVGFASGWSSSGPSKPEGDREEPG